MSALSAVVRIKDVQFRVSENEILEVPFMADQEPGSSIELDQVLMLSGEESKVGNPLVSGAKVTAEVLDHGRGRKILVFKIKRRKTYRKMQGHRQNYTTLKITSISG